jgi:UDP-glucose 4-epimerase|tara:strand:+ start:2653 stop:3513 length:861 start_codon:yes stop_codon:yes gene_type:complete
MKVLVTGGAGFIGTNLIKSLLKKGHEVISIDNYNTGLKVNHQQGCKYINNDIRDFSTYQSHNSYHLHNVDVVFHMAAIARIQPSFDNPQDYFTTNANGTLNLVDWCVKNKIPFIYAGSSSKHNGKFKNPYTFSKDIGEEIIKLYQEHFSLKSSITRFYNVYGQYQLLSGGYTTLIGRWINNINEGLRSVIYGDGEKRRDFTHVDDIVNALILIMEKEAYGYEFELGRGKNYSVNEVAEMFGITPEYEANKKGEAQNTLNTDTTAYDVLGWEPKINLKNYLKNKYGE